MRKSFICLFDKKHLEPLHIEGSRTPRNVLLQQLFIYLHVLLMYFLVFIL